MPWKLFSIIFLIDNENDNDNKKKMKKKTAIKF